MIYPIPKKYEKKDGTYTFQTIFAGVDLFDFYNFCKECHEIKCETNMILGKEEYLLAVNTDGVRIETSTDEGIYRAASSLYQLYKRGAGTIACCEVADKPDFERRGYMLDISRSRTPKPEVIKQLVDLLSFLKYNEFQLYIDNFVFKYPLIPQVTEGIDCLTPEDIRELDAYCRQRYIDLVPNQNCFGHMEHWLEREEYKHLEVGYPQEKTATVNPLLEETNNLIDMIFDSLLPFYNSEYVNIGLDEAFGLGKFQLEEYCKEHGKDNVFMDYLTRLSDRIGEKYNKKVQFWADMITSYPDSFRRIPKGSVALEWGYEVKSITKMEQHCKDLKSKGVDFYVCPSVNTHFSLTGRFDVASYNLRTTAEIGRNYGAKGYLVTDWHFTQDPQFGIWSFLPAAVGGQYSWNVEEEQKELIMETYFERRARDFLDFFFFEGKPVSEQLQRLANYFLLEPERVRLGTMCGMLLPFPLETTSYGAYFDIKDCGDDFYFDNVVRYVEGILVDVENLEMDQQYKREIIVNAKVVILSAKLCKVRLHMKLGGALKELSNLLDEIAIEYEELWHKRYYKKGVECFLNTLAERKVEIARLTE